MTARRPPARPSRRKARRVKGTTTVRRGMQWPHESDGEALEHWNASVDSWNGKTVPAIVA